MAVSPDLIAVALGRTALAADDVEYQQWSLWIDDARMLIEARLGDLDELDQAKLDFVVREAVVALARRPDDATQVTVTVDDATSSKTYRSGTGRVTILDEWWELLSPTAPSGRAFEVDTMPSDAGVYGVDYWWSGPDTKATF